MNREKELEGLAKPLEQIRSLFGGVLTASEEAIAQEVWLARAELAAKDNQVIAELAGALEEVNQHPYHVIIRVRELLTKHAERIKQAQETREGE